GDVEMRKYLLIPGPTPIPPRVSKAMTQPMVGHRSPEYSEILKRVFENLKYVFQTENDILVFSSSGTVGMEASIVNLLSPGDKAIALAGGAFGERFVKILKSFGVEVIPLRCEWGEVIDSKLVARELDRNRDIRAVFATLVETSTGVVSDIRSLGKICRERKTLLVVDAVSGLGVEELRTDDWGVDVVISASQKGLMTPPGLSFISISERAWEASETSRIYRFYWDFKTYREFLEKGQPPYTPPVSLVFGLDEALKMIREKGMEKVWECQKRLAQATREGVKGLDLQLLAKGSFSNGVTAIKIPENIDGLEILKRLREKYGVTLAGGQGQLKGKIFRIGHMGYIQFKDILVALGSLEKTLLSLGHRLKRGEAVKKAKKTRAGSLVRS
ncbi:alanine--glyoxylate aminotransferase family protein, partial [bacterium]|nr:alanine--glyoxylate aminotransferase family protein [bacterium]